MSLQVHAARVAFTPLQTRMPFKYGIATMTDLPHAWVEIELTWNDQRGHGYAADHLPPKWFTKDPDADPADEIVEMKAVITEALADVCTMSATSPFAWWQKLYALRMANSPRPALLQHFGVSLAERAMLDAVARLEGKPLWQLIQANTLGIDLGALSPELAGRQPADFLPAEPLATATLRHTVGLADPLRESDLTEENRLTDGLPQALETCIRHYSLLEFKLKLSGNFDADVERLRAIAEVITECAPADFRFSLDGNENFAQPEEMTAFGERVYADATLSAFFEHLAFIEQPIKRTVALADTAGDVRAAWPRAVPILIDESDGALEDFPRALERGYAGVSHKNCKGLFKGLRNRCLIAARAESAPKERGWLMSGEDLANVGPIALLQDLAAQALLGNASVERNGHHYFTGLSMFPADSQQSVLEHHADLYATLLDGTPTLRAENGHLQLASVNAAPFGLGFTPVLNALPQAELHRFSA